MSASTGSGATAPPTWGVVVPSLGRLTLGQLLTSLAAQEHLPDDVVVVDDRPVPGPTGDTDDARLPLAVLTALCVAVAAGLVNGLLVSRLRRKLGEHSGGPLFHTVRNGGYQLAVPVEIAG